MQYLKYPTKIMNITQDYNGSASHKASSSGVPVSYPIDDNCGDAERSNFYAPCDLTIKRIYGVGTTGINTIWLESTEKIKLANGNESYITMLVMHVDDDDLSKLTVGESFKQGEYIFREGRDGYDRGYASGYHFHIEVSTCKFSELPGNGWVQNSNKVWVISKNSMKPEEAFYVDKSFTTIKNSASLNFKSMPASTDSSLNEPNVPSTDYYSNKTYVGTSITTALSQIGVDSSLANRTKIALANGISNYNGTSVQNDALLNLLKQGKLKKETILANSTDSLYYPKSSYVGTSVVTALDQLKIDSSYSYRAKIAAKNGITSYNGSVEQNTKMLNLLKQGKLKKV